MSDGKDIQIKLFFYGTCMTGKTRLCHRFFFNSFDFYRYSETRYNLDSYTKNLNIDGEMITIIGIDPGSNVNFQHSILDLYKNFNCIFILYDITRLETFQDAKRLLQHIKASDYSFDDIVITLVGSKCDLKERQIQTEEAKKFAESENILFTEISSLESINVDEVFTNAIREYIKINNKSICASQIEPKIQSCVSHSISKALPTNIKRKIRESKNEI